MTCLGCVASSGTWCTNRVRVEDDPWSDFNFDNCARQLCLLALEDKICGHWLSRHEMVLEFLAGYGSFVCGVGGCVACEA